MHNQQIKNKNINSLHYKKEKITNIQHLNKAKNISILL